MRELFARHGFANPEKAEDSRRMQQFFQNSVQAAQRQSDPSIPRLVRVGSTINQFVERRTKRRITDLQKFSESVLPSRAIRLIRNGVTKLDFGVQPNKTVPADQRDSKIFEEASDIVRRVLDHPNITEDDWTVFLGPIIEDILVFDAGCWEYVLNPPNIRGNDILALEVVNGTTIHLNPRWDGSSDSIRYAQVVDSAVRAKFTDSQLEYLMSRNRSWTPWGISPLETAIEIMESWINLAAYQREVASNAYPAFALWLGANSDESQKEIMKLWWDSDMRGRSEPGIFGNIDKPDVLQLKTINDDGLYLKYQDMLVRSIALGFDLKPQDLNIERDINRNTAEVSQTASVEEARKPIAQLIKRKVDKGIIKAIAESQEGALGEAINHMEFFWKDLDPRDARIDAEIHESYAKKPILMVDEIRADLDKEPLPFGLGKMPPQALEEFIKVDMGKIWLLESKEFMDAIKQVQELEPGSPPSRELEETIDSDLEVDDEKMVAAIRRLRNFDLEAPARILEAIRVTRNKTMVNNNGS